MSPIVVGLLVLGVPLLIAGMILFGRMRPVFLFYLALLVVGLGYLATTDTPREIGVIALEKTGFAPPPKPMPAKSVSSPPAAAQPTGGPPSPVRTIPNDPPAPATTPSK